MVSEFTRETFQFLKNHVEERRPFTYGEVAQAVGGMALGMWQPLWKIWQFCDEHNLPQLNALVVNQDTGLPGDGFTPSGRPVSRAQWEQICNQVWSFDWSNIEIR